MGVVMNLKLASKYLCISLRVVLPCITAYVVYGISSYDLY